MSASSSSSAAGVPPQAEKLVPIAPGSTAKIRGPVTVAILAIVTLGVYLLFWWYFVNREMADYGRTRGAKELGDSPTKSLLALFPGGIIVVPAIWTTVTTFQRIQAAQRLNGQTAVNGWLGFVLFIVFQPALYGYMQSGLNSAWRATTPAN
jgi:hypothetical protein